MSHFVTVVLVPRETPECCIPELIAKMLAPFDQDLEVPEYLRTCWCVGLAALADIEQSIKNQHTNQEEPPTMAADGVVQSEPQRVSFEDLLSKHPLREMPSANCETCNGSGKCPSTSNARGKWDWHVIGGRWDGWLFGPEREAACSDKHDGLNFGTEHEQLLNNARPVHEIPIDDPYYLPFAVLTPDGVWHEVGNMAPFAIVVNEMPTEEWHEIVRQIYSKYKDYLAVAVDCHG